jgi:hypothetical protein
MSRRLDGTLPPTTSGWTRYEPHTTGGVLLTSPAACSRRKAMHHWIRRLEPQKAADMARALFRDAMRDLAKAERRLCR